HEAERIRDNHGHRDGSHERRQKAVLDEILAALVLNETLGELKHGETLHSQCAALLSALGPTSLDSDSPDADGSRSTASNAPAAGPGFRRSRAGLSEAAAGKCRGVRARGDV